MKSRRSTLKRMITPPSYIPKFTPGQRVCISPQGVHWKLAAPGTMGTVEWCGLVVRVLIDGADRSQNYAPDFWTAA